MSKFSDTAKKATEANQNPYTEGLDKYNCEQLIAAAGNEVTITTAFYVQMKDTATKALKDVPCFICKEIPDKFISAGTSFGKILEAWLNLFEGNLDAMNAGLKAEPVKFKIEKTKTNDGRPFWKFSVV